jgi:hypothetical protein
MSKNYLGAALALYNGYLAVRSIISGDDDFVGLAAGVSNIGTAPTDLVLMNEYNSPRGWIRVHLNTACGNGVCDTGEAATTCSGDCGTCCHLRRNGALRLLVRRRLRGLRRLLRQQVPRLRQLIRSRGGAGPGSPPGGHRDRRRSGEPRPREVAR